MKKYILFLIWLLTSFTSYSQERVITVGAQIKPIFSSKFFGTGPIEIGEQGYTYGIKPNSGYAIGMVVRRGFTPTLSLEFGLNYIVRKFELNANNGVLNSAADMRIVGYEIPISQLVFIRLSEKMYMNASAGICINMFPSDVYKDEPNFLVYAGRNSMFQPSLIANIGIEYRTKENGYFYLGTSLNRPFSNIYEYRVDYVNKKDVLNSAATSLNGTYLSIDFKYFFHEDPEKKGKAKSKK
jgi:hypothetical protein